MRDEEIERMQATGACSKLMISRFISLASASATVSRFFRAKKIPKPRFGMIRFSGIPKSSGSELIVALKTELLQIKTAHFEGLR